MRRLAAGLVCLLWVVGCEQAAPISKNAPPSSASRSSAPPPPPAPSDNDDASPIGDDVTADQNTEDYEREVAQVGVGKKGRNYGGGVISEPIRQYFRAGQRIHLLNMDRAMRMYKAEHGKLPASHDDFMKKIIEANSIELPELPDGERYVYDPKLGQLMVERPKP